MDPVQIPPIRTPLQFDPKSNNGDAAQNTEQTTKEWYLFWDNLNSLAADNAQRIDDLAVPPSGNDAMGPVTGFTTAHEIGVRYADTDKDRLVHLTVGFTPVMPTPQSVTYLVSADNGSTWVWIGSQRMLHAGQELKVDRLAPGQDSQWKVAAIAGNLGGDPSPISDANLDTLYPGVLRSNSFPVLGLKTPIAATGITATIGSWSDAIRADGSHYGIIPGVTYTDPIGTTAFFVRLTVQNLDASKNPIKDEQPYGGTQITLGSHTEPDLLITYIPGLAFMRYRFYLANRNSQGGGDFTDPTTNTLQQVLFNGSATTADHYDVPITIPPDPGPGGTDFNVTSVTGSEVGPKYQDEKQGLHTSVGIIPVIDEDYSVPRTVTIWLDFGDGTPVWQGWFALTFSGETVRIGDATLGTDGVRKSGDIWVPANTAMGTWQVWCGSGRLDKGVNPNAYAHSSFTVIPVAACSPTGTTNAHFVNNPDSSNPGFNTPFVYSKYDPGIWYWEYFELSWQPPTLAQEPNYWFTLLTVQKGHWDGTTWTPAPDSEGRSDDPMGQYVGRVMDEVVLASGIDPTAIAIMSKYGANPATWKIPPAQNPDFSTNVYRDFRFLIYNVSRLGTDASGSGGAGTYTLQTTCWPGGKAWFILTPVPQASVLDIRAANPNTIALPLVGGNGQPLTVDAYNPGTGTGGIGAGYLGPQAVQAVNMAQDSITAANKALAANSVVNGNINDVSVAKFTAGTSIFTGDVVLSRGPGKPVIVLQNDGIYLYGQADASTGATGLISKPHVVVQNTGILLLQGDPATTGSVFLDAVNAAITIYSVNGDITKPYYTISAAGMSLVNGSNSFAVNSNAMSFLDKVNHNRIDISSAGIVITNGLNASFQPATNANQVKVTATALQLILAGVPCVTVDSTGVTVSNGGTASVVISPTTASIINGTFHYVSGGVTVDINPSISTPIGTANGMAIQSGANATVLTSSAVNIATTGATGTVNPNGLTFSGSLGQGSIGNSVTLGYPQAYLQDANGNAARLQANALSFSKLGAAFVTVIDSNLIWRNGVQCTDHIIGADFGISGVGFGVGTPGTPRTFTTADGRTATVVGGIITSLVP